MPDTSRDGSASSPSEPGSGEQHDATIDESIQELDEDLPERLQVDPGTTGTKG